MRKRPRRRGQSLVEFTLLLPVLMIVLLGLLDLGRAYYAYVAITDAAGEGAAYGARHPDDTSEIKRRASEATKGLVELTTADVDVSASTGAITVTVTYELQLFTPMVRSMVPGDVLSLQAVAVHVI